jgi:CYTH domain-containing protein
MKTEIEKKFLVVDPVFKGQATSRHHILQGYLSKDPERTVRIRVKDKEGWLTIKGKSSDNGTTRLEWETPIPFKEAKALLRLALCKPIEKIRYIIPHEEFTFEVDEFLSPKNNLILAEIELPTENTSFEKPQWLGKEVTGDPSYYNAMM